MDLGLLPHRNCILPKNPDLDSCRGLNLLFLLIKRFRLTDFWTVVSIVQVDPPQKKGVDFCQAVLVSLELRTSDLRAV